MSEENLNTPAEGTDTQVELSPVEARALEMGWRPKEEFHGDEADFVDAKEFIARQPLFDKISHQSREIKEVRKALEALKTHYTSVRETEYNRALTQLKASRKEALANGDGDAFESADEAIRSVEKQIEVIKETRDTPMVQDEPDEHPEFKAWKSQNSWYGNVGYMRKYADELGIQLRNDGLSPQEVLAQVAKAVRKEFPHKFENPNRRTAAPVGESGGSGGSKKGFSESNLTEQERNIMNTLVRGKHITKEKYLSDLAATKGVK